MKCDNAPEWGARIERGVVTDQQRNTYREELRQAGIGIRRTQKQDGRYARGKR